MTFKREYYSGLNCREARHLVGRKVQLSYDAVDWIGPCILNSIQTAEGWRERFWCAEGRSSIYIRTCPETYPQKTIKIGEHELPMPLTKPLEPGTLYFLFNPDDEKGYTEDTWNTETIDREYMEAGMVHTEEENAKIWAAWWNLVVKKQMYPL